MPNLSDINEKPEEYISKIYEFASNPQGYLLLAGSNGTGKSFIAETLFSIYPEQDTDLKMFISQTDLNLKWQKQAKEWGETIYLLNQIVNTKILVLDDVGTRIPTESFMDFLYAIVDKRYTNRFNCCTILTTNLNSQLMRSRFGDAFVSRVASGLCLRYDGQDRRFNKF